MDKISQLLNIYKTYYENLDDDFKKKESFSDLFCAGICDSGKEKTIMFIGREALNWWFEEPVIENSQNYAMTYLSKQLNVECVNNTGYEIQTNSSPFWTFLRKVALNENKLEYNVCWTNLDKFHQIQECKGVKKTVALTYEQETILHNPIIRANTNYAQIIAVHI